MAESTVHKKSAAMAELEDHIDLTRALMEGTSAMRALGTKYMPMFQLEELEPYQRRLNRATLHPVFSRTVKTLTGKPFSKQINRDEVSAQLKEFLDDIDLEGRNLDAFAAEGFEFTMANGIAGILIEFPDTAKLNLPTNEAGLRSLATEKEAGLRPYWVLIKAWQLLGWKDERVRGRKVVTQLRLMEWVDEQDPTDEFVTKRVVQVRVIEPTTWRTFREDPNRPGEWPEHDRGVNTAGFVPFVPCYGDRKGFLQGKPALLELAHLNVKHWQSQADQDNLLHVARVPILVAAGVDPNDKKFKLVLGGSNFVKLGAGQSLEFVEHTGQAIGAGQESLNELLNQCKEAGAELLLLEPGEVTATKTVSDNEVGRCVLQRMTLAYQDALNFALDMTGRWIGMKEGEAGEVKLFTDFGAASLADASAQLLVTWNTANKLSDETTFEELQRRGTIRPDLSWEEEKERLEEQGPPLADMQGEQGMTLEQQRFQREQEDHQMSLEERRQALRQGKEQHKTGQEGAMLSNEGKRIEQSNVVQMGKRSRFVQR